MVRMTDRHGRLIATGITLLGLGILAWVPNAANLRAFAVVFLLLFHAHSLASAFFPKTPRFPGRLMGLVVILAAQSVFQTIWYYADGKLGTASDIFSLAASVICLQFAALFSLPAETDPPETASEKTDPASWLWIAALSLPAVVSAAFVLRHAWLASTAQSIRTPWPLLPAGTLAAVAIGAMAVWALARRSRSLGIMAAFTSVSLLAVTLIAPLLYRLGFGFDGFLHRASEQLLLATGALSPKPPYYIGMYAFVTWLARVFSLPMRSIDIFLVPLAIMLLPLSLWVVRSRPQFFPAFLAFLPLAPFVATTPQSFAYLLGLIALILALDKQESGIHPIVPLAIGAWSLATHPLAGLPFFGGVVVLLSPPRTVWRWIAGTFAVVSVPLAFFLRKSASATIAWNFSNLANGNTYLAALRQSFLPPQTHVALWADWASFVSFIFPLALFASAVYGTVRDRGRRSSWLPLSVLGACFIGAGFFLKTAGDFTFLIGYERSNYADRLFVIAQLFWLLPAAAGLSLLAERAWKKAATGMVAFLLFAAAWQAASVYLALPRHDAAAVGHGWSVGAADFDAVRFIDQDAAGKPYTVLADQSVSAAAVETFGFKRYAGDIFYYPIPTGGPLYEVFLRAAGKEPTRETMREAAALGKSDLVYVVLNDYWWDAQHVGEELASSTDKMRAFGDGKDTVYKFDFSKDKN